MKQATLSDAPSFLNINDRAMWVLGFNARVDGQMGNEITDSVRMDFMASERIALVPEMQGQWTAEVFSDGDSPAAVYHGETPRAAVDAAIADIRARRRANLSA